MRIRLSPLVLSALLAACGAAVQDRTAATLVRNGAGLYDLTVNVEKAAPGTSIGPVEAVTSVGTYPMAPAGGNDWTGQIPVAACVNGFDVRYEAAWTLLLAGNIAREPQAGVRQKWLTGPPPQGCSTEFGRLFVVNSTDDLVDVKPGDGICAAAGPGAPCTLRAAVMEANASPGQDRIELGGGTYTLTRKGVDDTAVSGDLDVFDEVAIVGTSTTVISAGDIGERVFDLSPSGDPVDLELRDLTVRDGRGPSGGGIRSRGRLHLFGVVVRDNIATAVGGGILNDNGFVELHGSELRDNTVNLDPGAGGGGLLSTGASASVLLQASSVTGNFSDQHGGGLMINDGSLEVRDSTIADNKASVNGGGFNLNSAVRARLRNVTVTGNRAGLSAGGSNGGGFHRVNGSGSLRLANTIVAENRGGNNGPNDCDGSFTSLGFNLFGTGDGCSGIDPAHDLAGTDPSPLDPQLGTLGGTMPRSRTPQAGSPAVGAGNPGNLNDERTERCTHVDQRGVERPKGPLVDGRARCDIGAVERE
jgi:CSLREA domain-containing protein